MLHGIDLKLSEGSFTALVGLSGGGKSTVAKLIARFWDVQEGRVLFGGRDVREYTCDGLLRNISMVFQNYALYPHLTVRQNIIFPLQKIGRASCRERV